MGVRDRDPVHPPHDSCPTIHTSQNSSQGDPRVWLRGVDSGGPHGGPQESHEVGTPGSRFHGLDANFFE